MKSSMRLLSLLLCLTFLLAMMPAVHATSLDDSAYNYYVAGDADFCDGIHWDPDAEPLMMYPIDEGIYELSLLCVTPGTYEYKITTGSWDSPSYGSADGGNLSITIKVACWVYIQFNAETKEITTEIAELGASAIKWQLNADASADDEAVDLRLITFVESLDYTSVEFLVTVNGVESNPMNCTTVYQAITANGALLTSKNIFGGEGYLVTYTIEDFPAEYFNADITVCAKFSALDGESWYNDGRTVNIYDAF